MLFIISYRLSCILLAGTWLVGRGVGVVHSHVSNRRTEHLGSVDNSIIIAHLGDDMVLSRRTVCSKNQREARPDILKNHRPRREAVVWITRGTISGHGL